MVESELQKKLISEAYGTDFEDDEEIGYESDESSMYELSAQEQWEESMRQITGLINFIIFPLIGKVLGRRCSHMIWGKVSEWLFI